MLGVGDGTGIEWTDATWNPTVGCTKVSPGCDHCYAETFVNRFAGSKGFPLPFDQMLLRSEQFLRLPLTWRKPRRIFVNSLSDLFHDDVPDEFIATVWAVMAEAPQHTFQVLTKRHGRMRSLLSSEHWLQMVADAACALPAWQGVRLLEDPPYVGRSGPLPNVWLGVSVEDQKWADIRIPALLATPAAVRWISAEPLIGPVDLYRWLWGSAASTSGYFVDGQYVSGGPGGQMMTRRPLNALHWVVAGGESGAGARPMAPEWARSLRDQCTDADVPFLFKQWGQHDAFGRRVDKKAAGRHLDGDLHDGYPSSP